MIYILYSCDYHKNIHSRKLRMASTNPKDIFKQIRTEVMKENMSYIGDIAYLERKNFQQINTELDYGYIELVPNGKPI